MSDAQCLYHIHIIEAEDSWGAGTSPTGGGSMAGGGIPETQAWLLVFCLVPRKQEASWEWDSNCPALPPPVSLESFLKHTVSLLPSPDGDWGGLRRQRHLTRDFSPACVGPLAVVFTIRLSDPESYLKPFNISGFRKLSNCCLSIPIGLT